ncbi:type II toxin-antitoxin system PemK/MazF family toxin [Clavibacter michiganensis]|uniref:mRNA interferase n=1 Tax=Clavibacter michiganensis TaxID=28447 RepID=A0A251YFY4_9MICO|nr:type II toxin-antitoxin system PemK/MazF family toxin [Clavibacter michiganensis]OUE23154.1 mRNA interferase MazF6 [Clavibacter michiganensis]
MLIARGDVVWVDPGTPRGSAPAVLRPAVVVQEDWLNASDIATVVIVPLTSNLRLGAFPGNVVVPAAATGLEHDSVAVVSQVGPVSRECLEPYPVGRLPPHVMGEISTGIRLVLGV